MSLSVTLTPEVGTTANAASAFSTAVANAEQKATLIAQGIISDIDTHAVIIIKSVALVAAGAFAVIVTLSSEIAPFVAGGA